MGTTDFDRVLMMIANNTSAFLTSRSILLFAAGGIQSVSGYAILNKYTYRQYNIGYRNNDMYIQSIYY